MNVHVWNLTNATLELANMWLREAQDRIPGDQLRTHSEMVALRRLFVKLHEQRIQVNMSRATSCQS